MNEWLAAKNILAVRLDNIGDIIMLGPALRAVKETSPQARLTLLASPAGSTAVPLLPWIDDVITWRPVWQDVGGSMPFDPVRERELINMLAERKFDAALIFTSFSQTPHTPGYVCYLAGIPLRAGESKEFGGSTLTTELRGSPCISHKRGVDETWDPAWGAGNNAFQGSPDELHQVERNLRLVEQLGFVARDRRLMIVIPEKARQAVPSLLEKVGLDPDEPFLLVHPGASARARRYPVERFGIIARLLSRDLKSTITCPPGRVPHTCWINPHSTDASLVDVLDQSAPYDRRRGWPILVTGVEREAALLAEVMQRAPNARYLVGGTTLAEYAALVERAALVICNDSLPMHLADAVGTPEIVLFSGTDYEEQWRPRATSHRLLRRPTSCHPCYLFECPIGLPCLDISPEEVVEVVETLLEEVGTAGKARQSLIAGGDG